MAWPQSYGRPYDCGHAMSPYTPQFIVYNVFYNVNKTETSPVGAMPKLKKLKKFRKYGQNVMKNSQKNPKYRKRVHCMRRMYTFMQTHEKYLVCKDYCVAQHEDSMCTVPNCKYHILLIAEKDNNKLMQNWTVFVFLRHVASHGHSKFWSPQFGQTQAFVPCLSDYQITLPLFESSLYCIQKLLGILIISKTYVLLVCLPIARKLSVAYFLNVGQSQG